jgi:hypothetical protein
MQYIKIDPICYLFLQVKDPHTSNAIQVVLAYALVFQRKVERTREQNHNIHDFERI